MLAEAAWPSGWLVGFMLCPILRLLRPIFSKSSSKEVALPHPKSRKDHYREKDEPRRGRVVWKVFKRTINITEYRNAEDDVNPANNRTYNALVHDRSLSMLALLQPGDNAFQVTDELLPAVFRAL